MTNNIKVRFKPTYEECKICEGNAIMHNYTPLCDKCKENREEYDLLSTGTVVKCFGTIMYETATISDKEGNLSVVKINDIEVVKKEV